ncbi:MAG: bifunctional UDP-N-acetylglucosamine diphosphorylase/glucosamine-1-phosphate N-acetyltransferase GlmU [Halioglobus sp.]
MNLEVIILAAGQGTRMRSPLPKVLHKVADKSLLEHVIIAARQLSPSNIHVVVGHGSQQVKAELAAHSLNWVDQQEQLGTGHAVLQALPAVQPGSTVLILYGDVPLIDSGSLKALVAATGNGNPALLTAKVAVPQGYGRVIRDVSGAVLGVVEDKDANPQERLVDEINTGVMAASTRDLAHYLPLVGNQNKQGEYYLPDILGLAVAEGRVVGAVLAGSEMDILGVNDRLQLSAVEREYQRRQAHNLLRQGVSVADPERLDIRGSLACGDNVSIDINVIFEGKVELGDGVSIGPNCVLRNVTVGAGAAIHAMSHLEDAIVGDHCSVGPFARLRVGTKLANGSRIGNFVETKKASIGAGSKVNHLSYIGDSSLGAEVNIGAGTITCNYDGVNKHQTILGDGVFVGSNSTLVAPLEVGDQGFVAAGSTITKPVATEQLAVGRGKQRNIKGWSRPNKTNNDKG